HVEIRQRSREDANGRVHRHHSIRAIEISCASENRTEPRKPKDWHWRSLKLGLHGPPFHHARTHRSYRFPISIEEGEHAVACRNWRHWRGSQRIEMKSRADCSNYRTLRRSAAGASRTVEAEIEAHQP